MAQRESWICLFLAVGALAAYGCGGRASARATTSPEPPPVPDWHRPSRMSGAVPAVRLDRPGEGDDSPEDVRSGEVPPPAGTRQVSLERGMTLYSLARSHHVSLATLMQVNGITDPTGIPAGTVIVIPASPGTAPRPRDAKKPRSPPRPAQTRDEPAPSPAAMNIAWPLSGRITAGFGRRGRHRHHAGVDIDGVTGEEVRAVAPGTVVVSGSEGKYGRTVVIDHGSGLTTLYAHASRLLVDEGDSVAQGEAIAEVGSTGNAHGSHLHFEVRRHGHPIDPSPYLRTGSVPLEAAVGQSAPDDSGSR